MPLVGSALQSSVRNESTGFAVFSGKIVLNDAVFLNRVRGNGRIGSARRGSNGTAAAETLIIVIETLYQIIPGAAAGAVHSCAAISTAVCSVQCDIALRSARQKIDELVLVARLKRHGLPNATIYQRRDRGLRRLNGLCAGFDRHLLAARAQFQMNVFIPGGSDADNDVRNFGALETF